ncbi:MAG: radical SAM protein [Candidatus Bathyarchaeia archaeon]
MIEGKHLKVYVSTNGCVEAQLSSTFVKQFFIENKVSVLNDPREADLIVFYACGLTEQKEKDSLAIINKLKNEAKPLSKLVVWGCLPKINPKASSKVFDGPVIGPTDLNYFEGFLEKAEITFNGLMWARAENMLIPTETMEKQDNRNVDAFTSMILFLKRRWDRLNGRAHKNMRFFIRTAVGCTGRCTYCSERCAFGRIKSRPIEKVISEFKYGLEKGYRQFSLIATDLGAYGRDINCTLSDLLTRIIDVGNDLSYKIILNQVSPSYLTQMFSDLEKVFASGRIEVLNCPIQSGSNRILKLMGRDYAAEEWREHMINIKKRYPKIKLSTHFMVGFPTETDDDFNATLGLLDYPLFLDDIYIFKFSKRPHVYASFIPEQVSEEIKELRYKKLMRKYAHMHIFNSTFRCISAPFNFVHRVKKERS